jgi:hypothetical protein
MGNLNKGILVRDRRLDVPRTRKRAPSVKNFPNVPSQEEIQIRAARIREDWTPRQHFKRSMSSGPLEIVEIRSSSHRRGFSEDW